MTNSDWITVVTSLIAAVAAGFVSWKLYQLQQSEKLSQLSERIKELSDKFDLEKSLGGRIDGIQDVVSIREKVEKIDGQLNSAVDNITKAIDAQQEVLEQSIHSKIVTQLGNARREFEECVRRELQDKEVRLEDQDQIANNMVDVFVQVTRTLNEMEVDTNQVTDEIKAELRVQRPLSEVKQAMHELREMVNLPRLLDGPKAKRVESDRIFYEEAKH